LEFGYVVGKYRCLDIMKCYRPSPGNRNHPFGKKPEPSIRKKTGIIHSEKNRNHPFGKKPESSIRKKTGTIHSEKNRILELIINNPIFRETGGIIPESRKIYGG